jgi:hypothetical protein
VRPRKVRSLPTPKPRVRRPYSPADRTAAPEIQPPEEEEGSDEPEERRVPRELLIVSLCFFLVGGFLCLSKRGNVRPLPEGHQGAQTTVAAMDARDMSAYGWFTILIGFGFLALAGKEWYGYESPEAKQTQDSQS